MQRLKQRLGEVPRYGWVLGVFYLAFQYGLYLLADLLSHVLGTIDHAFVPKIPVLDDMIPVVPAFIVIYLFSYVFWVFGPIIASLTEKRNFLNYMIGLTAAYLIGFLIFVFAPTYMDRTAEGLTEIAAQPGIFQQWMAIVHAADGGNLAFNLFPSYHCLSSLYCYLGIRKREEVSRGIRVYSVIMTILICCSTVLTKQHYLPDVAGGLGIALVCYLIVQKVDPAGKILKKREA